MIHMQARRLYLGLRFRLKQEVIEGLGLETWLHTQFSLQERAALLIEA
jgi:hypothetical protein